MNDDKTARDYNIEGGSVLHLVSYLADSEVFMVLLLTLKFCLEEGQNTKSCCSCCC
jgi:hypothetical protein